MNKFIALVGTNSDKSTNRKLLQYMKNHFADKAELELVEIRDIPIFDMPEDMKLPAIVEEISNKINDSDGVIISTPEYDHSVPASLSNALAWLSYGNYPFVNKPVMITGASYGSLGTSRAQAHLRQILDAPELHARIMSSSEFLLDHSLQAFDNAGNLTDTKAAENLDDLFDDFVTFADLNKHLDNSKDKQKAESFNWQA
ncbi:NADPH-dependent FMN reductase [Lentilactobacillus laojiaonis]|uniref:NADPH-dependent FMN reductase n=1 Tax=Lentilactobacillus laojiaonis TaxID=2883998 RepID=UPI001D0B2F8A|nr:NADPH-dependent FMN reductase [Lentilactobacillus laojiaonis]UDM32335.1 NAD(P)H-dependent oxidoreductase [Lentilactobacillus laojiaonis]